MVCIEERDGADALVKYHVGGGQFVDERVASYDAGSDRFTYYALGTNFSVIAAGDAAGAVRRTDITPGGDFAGGLGVGIVFDADDDGDIDLDDYGDFAPCVSGPGQALNPGCEVHDADGDQDVDLADFAAFQVCVSGPGVAPGPACKLPPPAPATGDFAIHGRPVDVLADGHVLVPVRARYFDPKNGRWYQRDPLGFADGNNLYEAFGTNPAVNTDPTGQIIGGGTLVAAGFTLFFILDEILDAPTGAPGERERVRQLQKQKDVESAFGLISFVGFGFAQPVGAAVGTRAAVSAFTRGAPRALSNAAGVTAGAFTTSTALAAQQEGALFVISVTGNDDEVHVPFLSDPRGFVDRSVAGGVVLVFVPVVTGQTNLLTPGNVAQNAGPVGTLRFGLETGIREFQAQSPQLARISAADTFLSGQGTRLPQLNLNIAAGAAQESLARTFVGQVFGEGIVNTQVRQGAVLQGLDFASFTTGPSGVQLFLNEVKAIGDLASPGRFTALGLGRGGPGVFEKNVLRTEEAIVNQVTDLALQRSLVRALSNAPIRLIGPPGFRVTPGTVRRIQEVTKRPVIVVNVP